MLPLVRLLGSKRLVDNRRPDEIKKMALDFVRQARNFNGEVWQCPADGLDYFGHKYASWDKSEDAGHGYALFWFLDALHQSLGSAELQSFGPDVSFDKDMFMYSRSFFKCM